MHDPILLYWARRLGATLTYMRMTGDVGLVDLLTRVVSIDIDSSPVEQRCTCMHELAHVHLKHGQPTTEAEYAAMEAAADRWAAEQLIPDALLEYALDIARDRREVEEICQVDPRTLDARLAIPSQRRSWLAIVPGPA